MPVGAISILWWLWSLEMTVIRSRVRACIPHMLQFLTVWFVPADCFLWSSNKSAELMDVLPESLSSRALASYWKRIENKKDFITSMSPLEVTSDNVRDYRHLELKWTILKVVPISVFTSLTLSLPPSHFWVTREWHLSLQPQRPHQLLVTLQLLEICAAIKNTN